MKGSVYLLIAVGLEILSTTALKASEGFARPAFAVAAFTGYALCFSCLSLALREIPVGIAYAIWCGLGIVGVNALGIWLFGERLTTTHLLGIGLVLAGVLILQLGTPASELPGGQDLEAAEHPDPAPAPEPDAPR